MPSGPVGFPIRFTDIDDLDVSGLFPSNDVKALIEVLDDVRQRAVA